MRASCRVLLASQLGVILTGVPQGVSGKYVAGHNELSAARSHSLDGKKMLLACADGAVFVQRFKQPFNGDVGAVKLRRWRGRIRIAMQRW